MASMVFAIRCDVQWLKESWKAWILTGVANRLGYFDTDLPRALSVPDLTLINGDLLSAHAAISRYRPCIAKAGGLVYTS